MQKFYFNTLLCLFFLLTKGFAVEPYPQESPWLTGPFFTPSGVVISKGHFNVEPYVFYTIQTGRYGDNWHSTAIPKFKQLATQLILKIGIHERANFTFIAQGFRNETQGKCRYSFGDLPIGFDIQLIKKSKTSLPLKLTIQESIPIGKYHQLSALNLGTDAIGTGSFSTKIGLTTSHMSEVSKNRFLSLSANFFVTVFAPVRLKGINSYGGDPSTDGKMYPGTSLNFYTSAEYTLTKNWALSFEILNEFSFNNRFEGHSKKNMNSAFSTLISLAPAIEYNFSKSIGAIVGSWFTIAGKNSISFYSTVGAINFYY